MLVLELLLVLGRLVEELVAAVACSRCQRAVGRIGMVCHGSFHELLHRHIAVGDRLHMSCCIYPEDRTFRKERKCDFDDLLSLLSSYDSDPFVADRIQ